jgi:peptidoglycan hydrolase-like protein with peptidoglycan-binding domain
MNVQAALNACNNAGLTVDGRFGTKSAAAAMAFQASKGLGADGKVGAMTKAALNSCGAPSNPSNPIPSNPSGAPLSINSAQAVSGYVNTQVGVGQVDKPVANIRLVTGAGGAGNLTSLNVSFYNGASGTDYQFTKYAQSVSVWLNGVKVGTLNSSDFSQYNSIFSAFIPVSGAILNANSTNNIVLAVTALPTIDSSNMNGDLWGVDVTSIRYSDASGVFTYNPSAIFGSTLSTSTTITSQNTYFSFAPASTAQSIKLTVTKNIGDSNDSVVVGQTSANTLGVTVAKIDLNAQGDTINLRRLPVTLARHSVTAVVASQVC